MPDVKEKLFTKMVKAGSRTYFIDVMNTFKGDKYLSICETKKADGKFQRNSILVFNDAIPNLYQALKEAAPVLKG